MHEMAIIQNVLRIVTDEANKANAQKVLKINIRMGEYSDVVPQILREYFEIAAKDTVASGAAIELIRVPATIRCRNCGWTGPISHNHVACKECGSTNIAMVSGREFFVDSIEVQ